MHITNLKTNSKSSYGTKAEKFKFINKLTQMEKINTLGPIKNGMLVTFKIKSFADNDTTIVIK